jgi:hypothetical protein
MDYNIARKLRFNTKSEHSSLYKWCINDIDDDGSNDGDFIPWVWGLIFTATALKVHRTVTLKNEPVENKVDESVNKTIQDCLITGDLFSGRCFDGKNLERYVSYSMFGTNRIIQNFGLSVYPVEIEQEENCFLWACPSYDSEIDFKNETSDDTVDINLFITREKFNELAQLIDKNAIQNAAVRLSQVDGFYAQWSPSITTRDIKVLTEYHEIENLEKKDKSIPRVEKVGEFNISYQTINELNPKPNRNPTGFYRKFDEEIDEPIDDFERQYKEGAPKNLDSPYKSIEQLIEQHNKTIKRFLWTFSILLVIIAAK